LITKVNRCVRRANAKKGIRMQQIHRSLAMGVLAALITNLALAQGNDSETLTITYDPIQLVSISSGNHSLTFNSAALAGNVGQDTITMTANGSSTLSYTLSNGIQITAAISFNTARAAIKDVHLTVGAGSNGAAERADIALWSNSALPVELAVIVPATVGFGQAESGRTLTYKVTLDVTAGGKFSSTIATVTYTAASAN
jgi:hypothetical protein